MEVYDVTSCNDCDFIQDCRPEEKLVWHLRFRVSCLQGLLPSNKKRHPSAQLYFVPTKGPKVQCG